MLRRKSQESALFLTSSGNSQPTKHPIGVRQSWLERCVPLDNLVEVLQEQLGQRTSAPKRLRMKAIFGGPGYVVRQVNRCRPSFGHNLKAHSWPLRNAPPASELHAPPARKLEEQAAKSARFQAPGCDVQWLAPEQPGTPIQERNAATAG